MAQHARQGSSSSSYPPAASPLSRRPRVKRRILFWPAFIPLILLSGLLMNWAILIPTAFAAPPAGTSAQGHLTFQQFLQEGQQSKASHGPFFFPQPKAPPKAGGMTPPKPSAEPPTMQPLVATLSASALAPQVAGSNVKPLNLKSNDGRLEVQIHNRECKIKCVRGHDKQAVMKKVEGEGNDQSPSQKRILQRHHHSEHIVG